jgi:hypothetical protein
MPILARVTIPDDQDLIANAVELVLDRLEAWRAGDDRGVAEIDAKIAKDPQTAAALWPAAFGIAERCLNVIQALNPAEEQRTLQSFRTQIRQYRS